MRKLLFLIVIAIYIIFITGCSISPNNINDTITTTVQTTVKNNINLISKGMVDTIEFGIGEKATNIIEAWGEPEAKDDFMGGSYITYTEVTFFIDEYLESVENGKVVKLGFSEGSQLFGLEVGMTFEKAKISLGSPSFEGIIGSDDGELFGKSKAIIYEKGNYRLLLVGDENSDFFNQAYLEINKK